MMTEKAARIAELEREIAELEAANEATPTWGWGAAVGARWESIKGLRAELARLRNETPAPTQGEGSEPVGWRLVPVEPTREMENAGALSIRDEEPKDWKSARQDALCTWEAMIAAAPSPPPLPEANADPRVAILERKLAEAVGAIPPHLRSKKSEYVSRERFDGVCAELNTLKSTIDRGVTLHADPRVREALKEVLAWAERRCPCENEQPSPCPLCGANANVPTDFCKAVPSTFPSSLLEKISKALALASTESQGLGEAAEWLEALADLMTKPHPTDSNGEPLIARVNLRNGYRQAAKALRSRASNRSA